LQFISLADVSDNDTVIDLRSLTEAPISPFVSALRMEASEIESGSGSLPQGSRIVLCCRTGVRAWRAARALQRLGHSDLTLLALNE
jgi:rhodanese-related sulfurtransferase